MLILHLSDIHFRSPRCMRPDTDPDRPFRSRMLQDIRSQVTSLGPVDAILIGGDIAFKAAPDEYVAAMKWFEELLEVTGCHFERLYVVPGNHDVDREIARAPAVKNAQAAIKTAEDQYRESVFREQFEDTDTGGTLLKPLAAYNDFAKVFSCQIYSPDHLYWKQDLELSDSVRLRLNGLTSTMLSGIGGGDDKRTQLYLSPLQTVLDPEDNVVNLVIAHHPPDWCLDMDAIEDDINDRAAIHLFGHKHRQRVVLANGHIRIGAAAVNPDRNEIGFEPGYNLIKIDVSGAGAGRMLDVEVHLRHLQRNPEQYRARLNGDDPVFRHQIAIPEQTNSRVANCFLPQTSPKVPVAAMVPTVPAPTHPTADTEAAMSDESTRNLVYRFWQLSISGRREIAEKLGLLETGEMSLPEPQRYGIALLRAGERNLIQSVAEEVKKRERS
ncbi:hypothetical protein NC77_20330 [Janthinobacterium lividum]|uniref:metallophosphoesterase n=1 Tax=Janthinobacterium lividum TaxID=29581 RepID=UPI00053892BC|nr:metallophosphoesterase [Janthinobacterium lividum]KHA77239.1 hypothetical protein NC77_20330 [Janthinobacterium lividum]